MAVREGMYRAVSEAFVSAGLPWDDHEDRGDGIFVLIRPEVPKSLLVEPLPSELVAALNGHNRVHPDEERIRLRMSLHAGEVHIDQNGSAGKSVNWAFRLIEAEPLKAALASSPGVLAIIVSSWFFSEVVRHAAAGVATSYRPVLVTAKDGTEPGWVCLPDYPLPAAEAAPALLADGFPQQVPALAVSPYKGPRAFEKKDENLSFGLGAAARQLMDADAPAAALRTLPRDTAAFTGRAAEMDSLVGAVGRAGAAGEVITVHAVDGMAGVGNPNPGANTPNRYPELVDSRIVIDLFAQLRA